MSLPGEYSFGPRTAVITFDETTPFPGAVVRVRLQTPLSLLFVPNNPLQGEMTAYEQSMRYIGYACLIEWNLTEPQYDANGEPVLDKKGQPVRVPIPCDYEHWLELPLEFCSAVRDAFNAKLEEHTTVNPTPPATSSDGATSPDSPTPIRASA